VRPAFGEEASWFATSMKEVQSALGDQHDGVVARATVRELAVQAHQAGDNAFSFGILYERDACRAPELEDQAWRAWKQASRPKYSKWMR